MLTKLRRKRREKQLETTKQHNSKATRERIKNKLKKILPGARWTRNTDDGFSTVYRNNQEQL